MTNPKESWEQLLRTVLNWSSKSELQGTHFSSSEFSRPFWTLKSGRRSQWRSFLNLFASLSHSSMGLFQISIPWAFSKEAERYLVARCLHPQWANLPHWGSKILLREPLISLQTLISMCEKHWLACVVECMRAKWLQSCPTLCDAMAYI